MIAIFEAQGKQYKVSINDIIKIEKLANPEGETVTFKKILLLSDKGETEIGTPFVEASVEAKVISHEKAKKIRVVKHKPKKRYLKVQGHRQNYTTIQITKINKETTSGK